MAKRKQRMRELVVRRSVTIQRPRSEVFAQLIENADLGGLRRKQGEGEAGKAAPSALEQVQGESLKWIDGGGRRASRQGRIDLREAPGGRGVEASVELRVQPPALVLGPARGLFRRLLSWRMRLALARLRQLVEVGEVARSS